MWYVLGAAGTLLFPVRFVAQVVDYRKTKKKIDSVVSGHVKDSLHSALAEAMVGRPSPSVSTVGNKREAWGRERPRNSRGSISPLDPTALSLRVLHMITVPPSQVSSELAFGRRTVDQWGCLAKVDAHG